MADEGAVPVARWDQWEFGVYRHDDDWTAIPGLYVFAGRPTDHLSDRLWLAVYVGQTTNFAARIPTHENWLAAVRLGATHVHARREDDAEKRAAIERHLVAEFQPRLNVLLR